MLATTQAKKLIQDANFDKVDDVFSMNIPQKYMDSTDKTQILVTDVSTDTELEGNDDFFATNKEIEVQIFYKLKLDFDPEELELPLLKLFKANNWHITQIREHVPDPDTFQVTGTFYFTKMEVIANG
ncbi:hypothetical protein LFYK43_16500 [Ligilactobacillus salitolerans]|uniref:Phage tail protein n=1 Tax=Ligilactobacillus salitolerans TaxID=1808352 RepID=A0A401IUH3_9LACO|nr:DUF806 family protein [Ligilactobacillus salitolerans]GBG95191.1 hypothetical protein LFYK43_16500 [Ligilactobacillus salitolerans]